MVPVAHLPTAYSENYNSEIVTIRNKKKKAEEIEDRSSDSTSCKRKKRSIVAEQVETILNKKSNHVVQHSKKIEDFKMHIEKEESELRSREEASKNESFWCAVRFGCSSGFLTTVTLGACGVPYQFSIPVGVGVGATAGYAKYQRIL